ncbi:DUF6261 family protein [Acetobacteroides hydrogenigenes]|uniref:Uncharacterized protein n=1 Tax=Acetobacteroides hydrogenigenes TaxID=979970 RepID=A0A4R2EJZ7_9BACT|nr:DUF6261 family protein [Acetobacteroides hydrogenigenes]TCN68881.1 hypothetical protein CLV25_10583 [Acetobacteroides hydrogenigenes]
MSKFLSFLRKCLLNSLVGYANDLNLILTAEENAELFASNAYKTYQGTFTRMELGYMQVRKNPYTDKVSEIAKMRGKSFQAIHMGIKSYLNSSIEAERNAAIILNALFTRYAAEFSNTSYSGATGMINSFIQDVKQQVYVDAMATLKLESKLQQLLAEEAEYEAVFLQSIMKNIEAEENEGASNIRNEFHADTRNLLVYIGIKASEEKTSKWAELYSTIAIHNAKFEKGEAVRQAALKKKREEKKNNQKPEA